MPRNSRRSDPLAARKLLSDYSLEMTGKDISDLLAAQSTIPAGTKINVTFLGNEDLELRVAAADAVRAAGFVPVPHISARRITSRAHLEEFLRRLQEVGASEHVFVVGGDPAAPQGPYGAALDIIRTGLLPEHGVREVSVAGYPEGHPDIRRDVLWRALEDKTAALAEQGLDSVLISQFAFDSDPVVTWIHEVRERGIHAQIRVGTPGPAGIKRLLGFARRFGIGANATIVKKYGFSITNLIGTAGPDDFVADLAAQLSGDSASGAVRLHFYTFGGLTATSHWVRDFRLAAV